MKTRAIQKSHHHGSGELLTTAELVLSVARVGRQEIWFVRELGGVLDLCETAVAVGAAEHSRTQLSATSSE